jgi:hypothetical protein
MAEERLKMTTTFDEEVIDIFVPISLKRRGGTAMLIMPYDEADEQKNFDDRIIKMIAKAHKWKVMLEEKKISSLAEIARKEDFGTAYVSKIFNLNFLSPKIVERILAGTQPRSLKLQDLTTQEMPDLWQEQEEHWGFN